MQRIGCHHTCLSAPPPPLLHHHRLCDIHLYMYFVLPSSLSRVPRSTVNRYFIYYSLQAVDLYAFCPAKCNYMYMCKMQ